jgi:hypothetical protein
MYDLPEMLIQQPVEFLTPITDKSLTVWSCLIDHWKVRELSFEMVFRTSKVLEFRNGIHDFQSSEKV